VVGGLVEQQHVGARQQQLAQRHAALLTAGQGADLGVPGRQAQASAAISSWVSISAPLVAMMFSYFACSSASLSKSASGSA
jgi:hypothetical protein